MYVVTKDFDDLDLPDGYMDSFKMAVERHKAKPDSFRAASEASFAKLMQDEALKHKNATREE